ncbi:hypothetical protein Poly41_54220 [Novipirellula artificiosorum]|uniref:Uncharacterized protein n=1 Tax=Novipirellula artificiosorum TaxID=2528016 RepID=A0A5C6DDP6_9BACT|nr:hypothetical protein Poly41_54220 [Novipirellula artificiosorum]
MAGSCSGLIDQARTGPGLKSPPSVNTLYDVFPNALALKKLLFADHELLDIEQLDDEVQRCIWRDRTGHPATPIAEFPWNLELDHSAFTH